MGMWRFWSLCAGAAVAGLSLAPTAGATPVTAHDRAAPALTARVVLPTTAYGAPRWGARRVMSLRGAPTRSTSSHPAGT